MNITAYKNDLARELFVRTADENYVAARWCAINRLNTDFLWQAVHSLEKYLKAVLLVNGLSTKGYGHDIVRLYTQVHQLAGPLLPDRLEKPANLDIHHWRERSAEAFMKHLLNSGNADNRYAIYGYVTSSEDLHMLDQMVFAIRRLVCELDEPAVPERRGAPAITHRDILARDPRYYGRMMDMPFSKLLSAKEDTPLRHAALNLNLAFAPSGYQHEAIPGVSSASNPVIMRRVLDPLGSNDPKTAAEAVELACWLLANVQVPKGKPSDPGVAEQIQTAIDAARVKHGLPKT